MAPANDSLSRTDWRRIPEVGTVWGIRCVVLIATLCGRAVATAILWPTALYYAVFAGRARRASKAYLARVGESTAFGSVVRHIHMFARVTLDRLFFVQGKLGSFVIETHGNEHLEKLKREGRGAIMLGSHLGSFDVMRAASRVAGLKVSVVVDDRSAARLGRVLRELDKESDVSIIPVDPEGIGTALAVRDAVKRGEFVGILADRVSEGDHRNVFVDFLGDRARLPTGPYVVAHALRCPVFQVFGIFEPPNRYDLYCEPFADVVEISRADREASLTRHVQAYAARLEAFTRKAPLNWFNLYDFWRTSALSGDSDKSTDRR